MLPTIPLTTLTRDVRYLPVWDIGDDVPDDPAD